MSAVVSGRKRRRLASPEDVLAAIDSDSDCLNTKAGGDEAEPWKGKRKKQPIPADVPSELSSDDETPIIAKNSFYNKRKRYLSPVERKEIEHTKATTDMVEEEPTNTNSKKTPKSEGKKPSRRNSQVDDDEIENLIKVQKRAAKSPRPDKRRAFAIDSLIGDDEIGDIVKIRAKPSRVSKEKILKSSPKVVLQKLDATPSRSSPRRKSSKVLQAKDTNSPLKEVFRNSPRRRSSVVRGSPLKSLTNSPRRKPSGVLGASDSSSPLKSFRNSQRRRSSGALAITGTDSPLKSIRNSPRRKSLGVMGANDSNSPRWSFRNSPNRISSKAKPGSPLKVSARKSPRKKLSQVLATTNFDSPVKESKGSPPRPLEAVMGVLLESGDESDIIPDTPIKESGMCTPLQATPAKSSSIRGTPAKSSPLKATPTKSTPLKSTAAKSSPCVNLRSASKKTNSSPRVDRKATRRLASPVVKLLRLNSEKKRTSSPVPADEAGSPESPWKGISQASEKKTPISGRKFFKNRTPSSARRSLSGSKSSSKVVVSKGFKLKFEAQRIGGKPLKKTPQSKKKPSKTSPKTRPAVRAKVPLVKPIVRTSPRKVAPPRSKLDELAMLFESDHTSEWDEPSSNDGVTPISSGKDSGVPIDEQDSHSFLSCSSDPVLLMSETSSVQSSPSISGRSSECGKLFPIFQKTDSPSSRQSSLVGSLPGTPQEQHFAPGRSSPRIAKKLIGKDDPEQMIMDAGQKSWGHTQCQACGMTYTVGEPEDEGVHSKYHQRMQAALKFPGLKNERVVFEGVSGDRIIMVLPDDKQLTKKMEAVRQVVDDDLGFVELSPAVRNNSKTFLYISSEKKIVGFSMAQPIKQGYRVLSEDSSSQESLTSRQRPWCCSTDPEPAKCGIGRIWVFRGARRSKVATKLLNIVRCHFMYGYPLSKEELAFSDPTPDGKHFITKYAETPNFLVYKYA